LKQAKQNLALLCLAIFVIGTGEELWMRFVPKYLEVLGATVLIIGLFDALKTFLGAAYAYVGGAVVDRWGNRTALQVFAIVSIVGYAVVASAAYWPAVLVATFLFLAWGDLSLPVMFTIVGSNLPARSHSTAIGTQALIKRIPILVGPVIGGVLIDKWGVGEGVRLGAGISVVAGIFAILVQRGIREACMVSASIASFWKTVMGFDSRLRSLLFSDILIRFCERIPYAWVVIYAMDQVRVSGKQMGALVSVEMITAMVCYLPAAHFADRYGKRPFVIATFIFFTLFPISLMLAQSLTGLVVAFAIRGLKEFGEPARKALIISYAPSEKRGRTVGAYYLIRDTVVTAGSFIGAALWKLGPNANFGAAALLGAAGTAVYFFTTATDE
jgi:MFS family permease